MTLEINKIGWEVMCSISKILTITVKHNENIMYRTIVDILMLCGMLYGRNYNYDY